MLDSVEVLNRLFSMCREENCGYTAGICSGAFNLGTKDLPLTVTQNNCLDIIVDLCSVVNEDWKSDMGIGFVVVAHASFLQSILQMGVVKTGASLIYGENKSCGMLPIFNGVYLYRSEQVPALYRNGTFIKTMICMKDVEIDKLKSTDVSVAVVLP